MLHIANQQALLGRYNFTLWDTVLKFKDLLHLIWEPQFLTLIVEDKMVARTALVACLDEADSAEHSMASAITMRCSFWLDSSGLPPEVLEPVQDLSFEGSLLFSEKMDKTLHSFRIVE